MRLDDPATIDSDRSSPAPSVAALPRAHPLASPPTASRREEIRMDVAVPLALRIAASLFAVAAPTAALDASAAGALTAPHPTCENIALDWPFSGDDDADGRVTVRFRRLGDATWRPAMPLFRIPAGANDGVSWGAHHSGSLFGLVPATTYEIEATLVDPDGGGAVQTIQATTRVEPRPGEGSLIVAVTPATLAGALATAGPGQIIELGAGSYAGFTVGRDGSEAQPLVVRSRAGAVVTGEIGLFSRHDVQIDGLTVHGRIRFNGSTRVAITRCAVSADASIGGGDAIAGVLRGEDCVVADNVVVGTTTWNEAALGAGGANAGEGIQVNGPGHIVARNRVRGFRDGIATMEGDLAEDQYSIDIVDNDISECADDAIQADATMHNCRVMRNRITDTFMGVSTQPSRGGPTYQIRDAMYNVVYEAFKLHNGTSGDVLLHNTVVKNGDAFGVWSGSPIVGLYARDNLLIGGPGGTYNGYANDSGRVIDLFDLDVASADLDYDGYGSTAGSFVGKFGAGALFDGLAELRALTSERHGAQVGLGVFAASVAYPAAPTSVYSPPDLRLASGAAAVDAGVAIANVDDGYAGAAPDLGAYEAGADAPRHGPDAPAPTIARIAVGDVSDATATVAWTTDAGADAQVVYGLTADYGACTPLDATLATTHACALAGLAAGTTYHYAVISRAVGGGLASSADRTFTTAEPGTTTGGTSGGTASGTSGGTASGTSGGTTSGTSGGTTSGTSGGTTSGTSGGTTSGTTGGAGTAGSTSGGTTASSRGSGHHGCGAGGSFAAAAVALGFVSRRGRRARG